MTYPAKEENRDITIGDTTVSEKTIEKWASKGASKIRDVALACGAYFYPAQFLKGAEATTKALKHQALTDAQTNQEIEAIREGRKEYIDGELKDVVVREEPDLQKAMLEQAARNVLADDLRKQFTLNQVVLEAESIVAEQADAEISDEPIDPDWFQAFKSYAENAQKTDLKVLWSKVLAGEAIKPGTYSLRTFHFLQHLSKNEAQLIEKLMAVTLEGRVILTNTSGKLGLENYITVDEILELVNMGVVIGHNAELSITPVLKPDSYLTLLNANRGISIKNNTQEEIHVRISNMLLTALGLNLLSLMDDVCIDESYLIQVAQHFSKTVADAEIYISIKRDEETISYPLENYIKNNNL